MTGIRCKKCFYLRNDWCEMVLDSPDPEIERDCPFYRTETNGDKIRAMTDEELARLLCTAMTCDECPRSDGCYKGHHGWLNWLKQEVEE